MRGNYITRFRGGKNLTALEGNASVSQVNALSRLSGEGMAAFSRRWGHGFDQMKGRRGREGGRGRVGQVNLRVETINPSCGEGGGGCGGRGGWRGGRALGRIDCTIAVIETLPQQWRVTIQRAHVEIASGILGEVAEKNMLPWP